MSRRRSGIVVAGATGADGESVDEQARSSIGVPARGDALPRHLSRHAPYMGRLNSGRCNPGGFQHCCGSLRVGVWKIGR